MESYSFGINSSWFLLLLLGLAAILLSVYVYRHTIPPISSVMKVILISLRSFALILLILFLFEPIMTMISSSTIEPKVAVLVDNSSSIGAVNNNINNRINNINKDYKTNDVEIKSSLGKLVNDFAPENVKIYTFSDGITEIEYLDIDSIKFDGNSTDISQSIRNLGKRRIDENIQAAVLISDGIFNNGTNPKYDAELFGKPIYTVSVGDSSQNRDLIVRSILTNEIAYLNTSVPINVKIVSAGYKDTIISVKLYDNGKIIEQQDVNLISERSEHDLIFEFNPKSEGMHKISASIDRLDNESTHKNNSLSVYIEVLGNKRVVSVFAGSSSPDLSFLLNELKKIDGIEIKKFIQKKGGEFYSKPTDSDIKSSELFILLGFPNSSTINDILNKINAELKNGKPLMFFASKDVNYKKLQVFDKYLPFELLGTNDKEFTVNVNVLETAKENPLIKYDNNEDVIAKWNKLPPVYKTETFVQAKPTSETLAILKSHNDLLTEPVILTQNLNEQKTAAFLVYGLYRWKLIDHATSIAKDDLNNVDIYSHLVNSSLRWLSVKENKKFVTVKTIKKQYNTNEVIEFIGQVYDQSYSPVNDAELSVTIFTGDESAILNMNSIGNGRYHGEIESFPVGDHVFKAKAIRSGQILGDDKGRFSIGPTSIEYVNLQMDTDLLRKIASNSGGKYYSIDQIEDLISEIRANKNFQAKSLTKHSEFSLWDNIWMLIFSLLFFSMEWFLRKRIGMV